MHYIIDTKNKTVLFSSMSKGDVSDFLFKNKDNKHLLPAIEDETIPSTYEYEKQILRNKTLDELGKKIPFEKFEFQMSDEERKLKERYDKLLEASSKFERIAGY